MVVLCVFCWLAGNCMDFYDTFLERECRRARSEHKHRLADDYIDRVIHGEEPPLTRMRKEGDKQW